MGLACELMRTLKTTNGILLDFPFLPQQYYAQNTFFKTFLYITQLILFSISFFFIYLFFSTLLFNCERDILKLLT